MERQPLTIDYGQLLRDLAAASEKDSTEREPGVFTRSEAEEVWGVSENVALRRIRRLRKQGRVIPTMTSRTDEWGDTTSIKAYRVVDSANLT